MVLTFRGIRRAQTDEQQLTAIVAEMIACAAEYITDKEKNSICLPSLAGRLSFTNSETKARQLFISHACVSLRYVRIDSQRSKKLCKTEIFGRGRNEVYLIIPRTILKITTGKSDGNYCYNQKLLQLKKMWREKAI